MSDAPVVYVVDDDPSVSRALERMFRGAGMRLKVFAAAKEFLAQGIIASPTCLVLDVQLPGRSGLDLQQELTERGWTVSITGHGSGAKYVMNSNLSTSAPDITRCSPGTGATAVFDAVGGGALGTQLLACIEAAQASKLTSPHRYGWSVYKHLGIYTVPSLLRDQVWFLGTRL